MGPYCMYCDHRCFVERRIPGKPGTRLMATCAAGRDHDQIATGYNHATAINPRLTPASSGPACQCEHESHESGRSHRYLGVPAAPRRNAMHVGPVCEDCAGGHMANYMVHCNACGSPDHWTEDHRSARKQGQ